MLKNLFIRCFSVIVVLSSIVAAQAEPSASLASVPDASEGAVSAAVEAIASAEITGAEKMTFGPSPDEAYSNIYKVVVKGVNGTTFTEESMNSQVNDFKVTWDIDGFKTSNDTEGQYCDSYGAFSVNGEGKMETSFELRDVPMNFYGRLTATITYNGTTTKAEKYVVALGNLSKSASQILPLAGYPKDCSVYPDALVGYQALTETYGAGSDLIFGGWCSAGSDPGKSAVFQKDDDGTKFFRFTSQTVKKSHVFTKTIDAPTAQVVFSAKLRFNNAGAVMTLTGGYPFWNSRRYTCPVSLSFDGTNVKLNNTPLTNGDAAVAFSAKTWYQLVLSADKSCEKCYAMVYDSNGNLLAKTNVLPWAETSSPTYFSIGFDNSYTGTVDIASCEAFLPTPDADSYSLNADNTTLSIPNEDTARLTASLKDTNGYEITQQAVWSVLEEDMKDMIVITPDAADSHVATVSLSPTAEAGTATVQVSIGGATKTIELSLTSSAEGIKFTQSTTSITIPMDDNETATAHFAATVIDGSGNPLDGNVTLAAYDKEGVAPYVFGEGITFDAATGELAVKASASPAVFTIRATGQSTSGQELSKSVKVNVHGMKFDFGYIADNAVEEGYTLIGASTAYSDANGYGIVSGTPTQGGTASDADAGKDYLQGAMEFDFKVQKGCFYSVEITYQGTLTTGFVNSDLTGYTLGTNETMATVTYTMPATLDVIDLHLADATNVARIAKVVVTKQKQRQKRSKRVVHHIGDSTSANNGSWAYKLKNVVKSEYPELAALCDFQNNGAGGRNLCTYYAQGKLANVLLDIYPDDIVMFGNNGTNGMGSTFEADMNYYLNAAETLGAKIIINSYTPHGCVGKYASGYDASTHTFNSYRKDSYDVVVRRVAGQRALSDANYLGFVEIGKNADAIFNAYVADYAANGYNNEEEAAQAIIGCFSDHNHYSVNALACNLMLGGYAKSSAKGIVEQLVNILSKESSGIINIDTYWNDNKAAANALAVYNLQGQQLSVPQKGINIIQGKKVLIK